MLTKLLITTAVIIIVSLIWRNQRPATAPTRRTAPDSEQAESGGPSSRVVAYAIVGVIVLAGLFFWYLDYTDDHRVMDIRITNAAGKVETYQAYQQDIKGKKFKTLDGRQVTIGDSERFEIMTH